MDFTYSGQNNYIDRLNPLGSAFILHSNNSPFYNCGIANDQDGYKTIGASFQFEGLNNINTGGCTKSELMAMYLYFLGLLPPSVPDVDFAGNITTGTAPLTVNFVSSNTGGLVDIWSWSFGDGGTSNQRNPSYTYQNPGNYHVTLTSTGPGGTNTEIKNDYIIVTSSGGGGGGGSGGTGSWGSAYNEMFDGRYLFGILPFMRKYRDEILMATPQGQVLVQELYKEHSEELAKILLTNPLLARRAGIMLKKNVLAITEILKGKKNVLAITEILKGKKISVNRSELAEIEALLRDISYPISIMG